MNLRDMKPTKFSWVVIWWYDNGTHRRGDVVSRHHTRSAAEKKCKDDSGFWGIVEIT